MSTAKQRVQLKIKFSKRVCLRDEVRLFFAVTPEKERKEFSPRAVIASPFGLSSFLHGD